MKKYIFAVSLSLFIFALSPLKTHAETMDAATVAATSASTYKLVHPGMLPDNPLYKLKVLRDTIMLSIIQSPLKKAEYRLLLADKQIGMVPLLVAKGNTTLAKETVLKGENQMTLITFLFKDTGTKPEKELYDRLIQASLKHQEVLREVQKLVPEEDKAVFETILEFSTRNADEFYKIVNE